MIADDFNTFWMFRFHDGSFWTDNVFDTKEQAERFSATNKDAEFVEGGELIEVVIVPKASLTLSAIRDTPTK